MLSKELALRVVSALVLGALTLFCTLHSALAFQALMLLGALLMYREWLQLTSTMHRAMKAIGLVYVALPIWALIVLRQQPDPTLYASLTLEGGDTRAAISTPFYVLYLFAVVWMTDSAAYFGGKWKGKHKLAPSVSPGKTWEGLGFGVVGAVLAGLLVALARPDLLAPWQGAAYALLLSPLSQVGDLFESWLKRKAGVKDSGKLIPGHGGILDRVDGLIFAAPILALLVLL